MSFILRCLDIFFSSLGLLIGAPLLIVIFILCLFDTGSPLFLQTRVGRHKKPFALLKFRTMRLGTASVATHLVDKSSITPFGAFLRRTKLDETLQLLNVLKGDMSLVGPRPCLFNQDELIIEREALNVFSMRPGITGLAQVLGVDMSTPKLLAEIDSQMLNSMTFSRYIGLIFLTFFGRKSSRQC